LHVKPYNMHKEYIDRYIHFHTVGSVIERGTRLHKNNAINPQSIDYQDDTADFTLMGTHLYQIRINGFLSNNIEASCTCPYNWNTLCKHSVAALLYIADLDDIHTKAISPDKRIYRETGKTPLLVPRYKKLNKSLIQRQLNQRNRNSYLLQGDIVNIKEIRKNSLVIEFDSTHHYGTEDIVFELSDDKLYVSSNATITLNGFSPREAGVLYRLIEIGYDHFFDYMFNGNFSKQVELYKKHYQLPDNTKFSDYFKIAFIQGELKYFLHNKGMGLISPSVNSHILKNLQTISQPINQVLHSVKKEIRELGFVIFPQAEYSNFIAITVIKGKTNKAGTTLTSHIGEYEDKAINEVVYPTENQKKLIELIKTYHHADTNNENDYYVSTDDTTHNNDDLQDITRINTLRESLSILKLIFTLLKQEKYIFKANNEAIYQNIRKKDLIPFDISLAPAKVLIKVSLKNSFIIAEAFIKYGDETVLLNEKAKENMSYFNIEDKNTLYIFDSINTCLFINDFSVPLRIHQEHKDFFMQKVIEPLSQQFEIQFTKNITIKEEHYPNAEFRQLYISEEEELLKFTPVIAYSNNIMYPLSQTGNKLEIGEKSTTEYKRDTEFENAFLDFLSGLHPNFENQKFNGFFHLSFDELMHNMWFYKFYEQLQKEGIDVYGMNDLKKFKYSPYQAKVATNFKSGEDWFEIDIQVQFGNYQIKIADLKKAIINKQQYIQLKNGTVGILPEEWLDKFQRYFRHGQVQDNKLLVSKLRFSIIDELYEGINNEEIIKEITDKRLRLKQVKEIEEVKIPRGIKAKLRHYQKEGLQWLNFLDKLKWGGILADDMGLGKTLQMLVFFKLNIKKNDAPALIIVPTTLLFNWENEIAKFAPSLKAHYHYGLKREKTTDHFSKFHLVFTSYGVLVRDIEMLKDFKFKYIVLDESQAIKNPMSQRYKAANLLKANNKFALTGTPIENSTFDLYAQMNFVNPGFFGDIKSFKDNYSNRIDKDGDMAISAELQKISKPFVLRRTKEQVATELPPKTENVLYCEMESEQRTVYDAYRNEYRDKILKKIDDDGIGKSKMYILEGLLRLRQICDSPALLKKESLQDKQSVKIQELLRFITEKTANHKILVFSQFVGMLQLIRQELDKHQIDYEYLDGKSSKNQRKDSVEHFQANEKIRVFLVSLKAGGTGLNLTAADYVFLVDPWWNPAVEEQAIDRCYRIGQDKKVFAYRMICKDTVEEKILHLQNKKKKIAGDIIQTDENIMKTMNTQDIRDLFS